jgi:hypothetical protein
MDLSFDHKDWQQAFPVGTAQRGCDFTPDWYALRARLAAAFSARREFAQADCRKTKTSGSFDQMSALALAGFHNSSRPINLTALGNGKSNGGIASHAVSESPADGRGNP